MAGAHNEGSGAHPPQEGRLKRILDGFSRLETPGKAAVVAAAATVIGAGGAIVDRLSRGGDSRPEARVVSVKARVSVPEHVAEAPDWKPPLNSSDCKEEDFFVKYLNGEFPAAERNRRRKIWRTRGAEPVAIFEDVGVNFYVVQAGDTKESIKRKLAAYPGYQYLLIQKRKIESFNIPGSEIKPGMLLPIPMENEDRHISDEQFAKLAFEALEEIANEPPYVEFIRYLRGQKSDTEIVAAMTAIAKQESGGYPIGQYELHRWEPAHKCFSFSAFHVLMEGPGLRARRTLGMTEGQLYHHKNAVKLFMAFIVEKLMLVYKDEGDDAQKKKKVSAKLVKLFDLGPEMAAFYNGNAWRRTNPGYLPNIKRYYGEALGKLKR